MELYYILIIKKHGHGKRKVAITMMENTYASLEHYLRRYEARKTGVPLPPHEQMLARLFAPYSDPRNADEFRAALKEMFSEDEAAVWCAYPEYTIDAVPKTPDDIRPALPESLRGRVEELTASLVKKLFLYPTPTGDGRTGYLCTYLLDVITWWCVRTDGSRMSAAVAHYWEDLMAGDSAKLRRSVTEHRVLPHEGALTGETAHGRIPMDLEIPDGRQVLPIDRASEMLGRCRRFAVMPCVCRTMEDNKHTRRCDYPVADVCITFDEAADSAISSGIGREVTREEALSIIRRCRDLGMSQIISNAAHPLALCNCCKCCCLCMRTLQRYEDVVCGPARFEVDVARRDACIGCGRCAMLCPMEAVCVENGKVQVRPAKCVGCGVCVSQCPKGVLRLRIKGGAPEELPQEKLDRVYI